MKVRVARGLVDAHERSDMSEATPTDGSPTVVLVHGAFADSSSWNGVIERLQARACR